MWAELQAENTDEEYREKETKHTTDDNFTGPMTYALLETGKLLTVHIEGIDEHIEVAALVTHVGTETDRIIDHDNSETDSERKDSRVDSLVVANSCDDRGDKGRVATRHVSIRKDILPVPIMFDAVNDKFDELSEAKSQNRYNEDGVGLKEGHR